MTARLLGAPWLGAPWLGVPWIVAACLFLFTVGRVALLHLDPRPLDPAEAALWALGQRFEAGGLGEWGSPLVGLMGGLIALGADAEPWLRTPGALALGLAAWGVWRLGALLYTPRIGAVAALVFLTLPGGLGSAGLATPAAFLPLVWAFAMHALLRGLKTDARRWWIGLGLCLGVGVSLEASLVLMVPCFLVYARLSPEYYGLARRPGLWLALALGAAGAVVGTSGAPLPDIQPLTPTPAAALRWLADQGLMLGPLGLGVLGAVAVGALRATGGEDRRSQGYRTRFFLAFSLPLALGLALLAALGQPVPPALGLPVGIGVSLLVAEGLGRFGRLVALGGIVAQGLLVGGVLQPEVVRRVTGLAVPEVLRPSPESQGAPEVGRWLAAVAQRYPGGSVTTDAPAFAPLLAYYARIPVEAAGDRSPTLLVTQDPRPPDLAPGTAAVGFFALEREPGQWLSWRAFFLHSSEPRS